MKSFFLKSVFIGTLLFSLLLNASETTGRKSDVRELTFPEKSVRTASTEYQLEGSDRLILQLSGSILKNYRLGNSGRYFYWLGVYEVYVRMAENLSSELKEAFYNHSDREFASFILSVCGQLQALSGTLPGGTYKSNIPWLDIVEQQDKVFNSIGAKLLNASGMVQPAPAEITYPVPGKGKIAKDRVNIRKGPGTDYDVIVTLTKDTELSLAGEKNDWFKVTLADGKNGYCAKRLITVVENSYQPETVPGFSFTSADISSAASFAGNILSKARIYKSYAGSPVTELDLYDYYFGVAVSDYQESRLFGSALRKLATHATVESVSKKIKSLASKIEVPDAQGNGYMYWQGIVTQDLITYKQIGSELMFVSAQKKAHSIDTDGDIIECEHCKYLYTDTDDGPIYECSCEGNCDCKDCPCCKDNHDQ